MTGPFKLATPKDCPDNDTRPTSPGAACPLGLKLDHFSVNCIPTPRTEGGYNISQEGISTVLRAQSGSAPLLPYLGTGSTQAPIESPLGLDSLKFWGSLALQSQVSGLRNFYATHHPPNTPQPALFFLPSKPARTDPIFISWGALRFPLFLWFSPQIFASSCRAGEMRTLLGRRNLRPHLLCSLSLARSPPCARGAKGLGGVQTLMHAYCHLLPAVPSLPRSSPTPPHTLGLF